MAHALTLSADFDLPPTIHPAMAATTAARATVPMGIEKLPVCCVTRPTAHIPTAPAREPQPLSTPIAVDTFVFETSCAIVRYMATQMPRPKFTSTSAITAPASVKTGTAAQHT